VQDPLAPVTVQVAPPGDAVTVYELGVPPELGATTAIVAVVPETVAVGLPGAFGVGSEVTGVEAALVIEGPDVPYELEAATENV